MTRETIYSYASTRSGLSVYDDTSAMGREAARMVGAGMLERRERTVTVPAMDSASVPHALSMGLDPTEHDARIVTFHVTDAGHADWSAMFTKETR